MPAKIFTGFSLFKVAQITQISIFFIAYLLFFFISITTTRNAAFRVWKCKEAYKFHMRAFSNQRL